MLRAVDIVVLAVVVVVAVPLLAFAVLQAPRRPLLLGAAAWAGWLTASLFAPDTGLREQARSTDSG